MDTVRSMEATESTAPAAMFVGSDKIVVGGGAALVVLAGLAHFGGWNSVLAFAVAAGAMALLASLVVGPSSSWATGSVRARPVSSSRRWATSRSCSSASSR